MKAFKRYHQLILTSIMVCISLSGVAQKNVDHQNLLWTRYYLKLKVDAKWTINQEFEERTYWFPWRQHQFVSRTLGQYQLGNGWNVGAGITYFLQALPQDPNIKEYDNQLELRPQLELAYKQQISETFAISHRYWSEFRYFEPEGEKLYYSNVRMRYKLELQYRPIKKITLKAYDEIFINIGKDVVYNVFDQNRIGASIQYMPTTNLGFELGYFNWFQQRVSGDDFYNRNIIRFTIYHNIHLQSKNP